MARGAPDYTRQMQIVVVEAQTEEETAAGDVDNYVGSDTTYQTLASWTVATGKIGELKEIFLATSGLVASPVVRITIAGTVWAEGWTPYDYMPIPFRDLRLAAGDEVLVEVKSSDGSAISIVCVITGKEIG